MEEVNEREGQMMVSGHLCCSVGIPTLLGMAPWRVAYRKELKNDEGNK